jgi:hypothetical protein
LLIFFIFLDFIDHIFAHILRKMPSFYRRGCEYRFECGDQKSPFLRPPIIPKITPHVSRGVVFDTRAKYFDKKTQLVLRCRL